MIMERIKACVSCECCGGNILKGKVKKTSAGYFCEMCVDELQRALFIEVDADNAYYGQARE